MDAFRSIFGSVIPRGRPSSKASVVVEYTATDNIKSKSHAIEKIHIVKDSVNTRYTTNFQSEKISVNNDFECESRFEFQVSLSKERLQYLQKITGHLLKCVEEFRRPHNEIFDHKLTELIVYEYNGEHLGLGDHMRERHIVKIMSDMFNYALSNTMSENDCMIIPSAVVYVLNLHTTAQSPEDTTERVTLSIAELLRLSDIMMKAVNLFVNRTNFGVLGKSDDPFERHIEYLIIRITACFKSEVNASLSMEDFWIQILSRFCEYIDILRRVLQKSDPKSISKSALVNHLTYCLDYLVPSVLLVRNRYPKLFPVLQTVYCDTCRNVLTVLEGSISAQDIHQMGYKEISIARKCLFQLSFPGDVIDFHSSLPLRYILDKHLETVDSMQNRSLEWIMHDEMQLHNNLNIHYLLSISHFIRENPSHQSEIIKECVSLLKLLMIGSPYSSYIVDSMAYSRPSDNSDKARALLIAHGFAVLLRHLSNLDNLAEFDGILIQHLDDEIYHMNEMRKRARNIRAMDSKQVDATIPNLPSNLEFSQSHYKRNNQSGRLALESTADFEMCEPDDLKNLLSAKELEVWNSEIESNQFVSTPSSSKKSVSISSKLSQRSVGHLRISVTSDQLNADGNVETYTITTSGNISITPPSRSKSILRKRSFDSKSSSKSSILEAVTHSVQYAEGDKIDALYTLKNGTSRWYPGTIISINSSGTYNTYSVRYDDDGLVADGLDESKLRHSKKNRFINRKSQKDIPITNNDFVTNDVPELKPIVEYRDREINEVMSLKSVVWDNVKTDRSQSINLQDCGSLSSSKGSYQFSDFLLDSENTSGRSLRSDSQSSEDSKNFIFSIPSVFTGFERSVKPNPIASLLVPKISFDNIAKSSSSHMNVSSLSSALLVGSYDDGDSASDDSDDYLDEEAVQYSTYERTFYVDDKEPNHEYDEELYVNSYPDISNAVVEDDDSRDDSDERTNGDGGLYWERSYTLAALILLQRCFQGGMLDISVCYQRVSVPWTICDKSDESLSRKVITTNKSPRMANIIFSIREFMEFSSIKELQNIAEYVLSSKNHIPHMRLLKLLSPKLFNNCLIRHMDSNGRKIGEGGFGSVYRVCCDGNSCGKFSYCQKYYQATGLAYSSNLCMINPTIAYTPNNSKRRMNDNFSFSDDESHQNDGRIRKYAHTETCYYAIKCISREKSSHDIATIFNIYNEVMCLELLSSRANDGICVLYDYGVRNNEYWLVVELGGCSLHEWRLRLPNSSTLSHIYSSTNDMKSNISSRRISDPRSQKFNKVLSIFDVIHCLLLYTDAIYIIKMVHAADIAHFDIKCNNFIIRHNKLDIWKIFEAHENNHSSGAIFLSDFGESIPFSSKYRSQNANGRNLTRSRGTLPIQSPEQLSMSNENAHSPHSPHNSVRNILDRNSSRHSVIDEKDDKTKDWIKFDYPDIRSDIWSLGTLLVELLTGNYLFADMPWPELFFRCCLREFQPLPLDSLRSAISNIPDVGVRQRIENVIMSTMKQMPNDRISLDDLLHRVKTIIKDLLHIGRGSDSDSASLYDDLATMNESAHNDDSSVVSRTWKEEISKLMTRENASDATVIRPSKSSQRRNSISPTSVSSRSSSRCSKSNIIYSLKRVHPESSHSSGNYSDRKKKCRSDPNDLCAASDVGSCSHVVVGGNYEEKVEFDQYIDIHSKVKLKPTLIHLGKSLFMLLMSNNLSTHHRDKSCGGSKATSDHIPEDLGSLSESKENMFEKMINKEIENCDLSHINYENREKLLSKLRSIKSTIELVFSHASISPKDAGKAIHDTWTTTGKSNPNPLAKILRSTKVNHIHYNIPLPVFGINDCHEINNEKDSTCSAFDMNCVRGDQDSLQSGLQDVFSKMTVSTQSREVINSEAVIKQLRAVLNKCQSHLHSNDEEKETQTPIIIAVAPCHIRDASKGSTNQEQQYYVTQITMATVIINYLCHHRNISYRNVSPFESIDKDLNRNSAASSGTKRDMEVDESNLRHRSQSTNETISSKVKHDIDINEQIQLIPRPKAQSKSKRFSIGKLKGLRKYFLRHKSNAPIVSVNIQTNATMSGDPNVPVDIPSSQHDSMSGQGLKEKHFKSIHESHDMAESVATSVNSNASNSRSKSDEKAMDNCLNTDDDRWIIDKNNNIDACMHLNKIAPHIQRGCNHYLYEYLYHQINN